MDMHLDFVNGISVGIEYDGDLDPAEFDYQHALLLDFFLIRLIIEW